MTSVYINVNWTVEVKVNKGLENTKGSTRSQPPDLLIHKRALDYKG